MESQDGTVGVWVSQAVIVSTGECVRDSTCGSSSIYRRIPSCISPDTVHRTSTQHQLALDNLRIGTLRRSALLCFLGRLLFGRGTACDRLSFRDGFRDVLLLFGLK